MKPKSQRPAKRSLAPPADPVRSGIASARQQWFALLPRYRGRERLLRLIARELEQFGVRRDGSMVPVSTHLRGLVLTVSVWHRDPHSLDPVETVVLNVSAKGASLSVADGAHDSASLGAPHDSWRTATRDAARRLELWCQRGHRPPPRRGLF